jgi:hypothetical protein
MIHKPKLDQKLYQDSCLNDVKICEMVSNHFWSMEHTCESNLQNAHPELQARSLARLLV